MAKSKSASKKKGAKSKAKSKSKRKSTSSPRPRKAPPVIEENEVNENSSAILEENLDKEPSAEEIRAIEPVVDPEGVQEPVLEEEEEDFTGNPDVPADDRG